MSERLERLAENAERRRLHRAASHLLAPETACGKEQIIPNWGAHVQFYPTHEQLCSLLLFGQIRYEPEYGPNARVYVPTAAADAGVVAQWM